MNEYQVTTAQNVTLSFNYASVGSRILACIIDNIVKIGYALTVGLFWYYLFRDLSYSWAILVIMALPYIFYSLIFEFFTNGTTPGKRAMKIRVAPLEGDQLTFGRCLIRWLFRLIDMGISYGIVAVVAVATAQRKQRLGDMVAGTIVLSASDTQTIEQTIYSYIDSGREVTYADVHLLTAREIIVIKEVLQQYLKNDKYELVAMTAQKVRTAINAPHDLDDVSFLKAVVQDYYMTAEK